MGFALARNRAIGLCVVAVASLAAACGGPSPAPDPAPQPVTTIGQTEAPQEAPDDAIRQYMEAIASNDPDEMRDGRDLAAEGSVASAYMRLQIVRADALLDGGLPILDYPYEMSRAGDGYELCLDGECTVFDSFKADERGLLTDLNVDGESPGPRLTLGNGDTVESNGVTAELLVAYEAITDNVFVVVLRLETGDQDASPFLYTSTYRAPDGAQREATDAWGPSDLGPNSHATVMLQFARVEPGGQVELTGCVADCLNDLLHYGPGRIGHLLHSLLIGEIDKARRERRDLGALSNRSRMAELPSPS